MKLGLLILGTFLTTGFVFQEPSTRGDIKLGIIQGIVEEADSAKPIAGAQVVTYDSGQRVETSTNSEGRFQFSSLREGRYRLFVTKEGFSVRREVNHNAPGSFEIWVTVLAGREENVALPMIRSSVITGRIVDFRGQPIRAMVGLARPGFGENGEPIVKTVPNAEGNVAAATNDRGEYRRYAVEPGEYLVVVSVPSDKTAFLAGAVFSTTFYPGTTDLAKALLVNIMPGEEVHLADLTIQPAIRSRVRIHSAGTSSNLFIYLSQPELGLMPTILGPFPQSEVELPGMPAGKYDFLLMNAPPGNNGIRPGALSGLLHLEVHGEDINQEIVMREGFRVNGQIASEDSSGHRVPVADARVILRPSSFGVTPNGTTDQGGTFTLDNVLPGTYRLQLTGLASNSYVSTATASGADILKEIIVTGETHIEILIKSEGSSIRGTVSDLAGKKTTSSTVVLVPDAPLDKATHLYRTAITDLNGAFHLNAIAPGNYLLFSWRELEGGAYRNSDFMKRYEGQGAPIQIGNKQELSINLKVLER